MKNMGLCLCISHELINEFLSLHSRLIDMDEHWAPTSYYCFFCAIDYDYVVKYENFSEEIPYIWEKIGQNQTVSQQRWNSPGTF